MNRIAQQPTAAENSLHRPRRLTPRGQSTPPPHCLFTPLHYEPGYAYPLLIWLHGPGDDEAQLQRIMPHISLRNHAAIAPRAVLPSEASGGFQWRQSDEDICEAERRVLACMEIAQQKLNISLRRIFLGGLHGGGTMALRLAWRNPRRFAGVATINSPFPQGGAPLAQIDAARSAPLWSAHGRDSLVYPAEQVCRDLRLSHLAGFRLELREYPCGDEVLTNMLSDLDVWMMEIITGVSTAPSQAASNERDV